MPVDERSTIDLPAPEQAVEEITTPCIRWMTPAAGRVTLLDESRLTLGRSADADVRLDTAGVSRLHAEVIRQGGALAIADTGSKNGLFVNGRAVPHAALRHGDVVRLGDALGVIDRVPARAASSSHVPGAALASDASELVGPCMSAALQSLLAVAASTLPVVLTGETGVGKERAAIALHRASGRSGPFHAINCAALPEPLAEAELFGHRKGAFTGAETSGLGHFRAAEGGTLFLDELQELSPKVQAILLRALQEGCVRPVGDTKSVPVDARIVVATQQPLRSLVDAGTLRVDLAMRLSGYNVSIPPLRERRSDIGILVFHFMEKYGNRPVPGVEVRCLEDLLLHDWPGNARELEFIVRRLLVLTGDGSMVRWRLLPEPLRPERAARTARAAPENRDQYERRAFREALGSNPGNIARAAREAGISRQRAYRLLSGRSVQEFLCDREVSPSAQSQGPDETPEDS